MDKADVVEEIEITFNLKTICEALIIESYSQLRYTQCGDIRETFTSAVQQMAYDPTNTGLCDNNHARSTVPERDLFKSWYVPHVFPRWGVIS